MKNLSLSKRMVGRAAPPLVALLLSLLLGQPEITLSMAGTPEISATPSWDSTPTPMDEENPQSALYQAKRRFQQAEKDFTVAENREANAALNQPQSATPAPATASQTGAAGTTQTPSARATPVPTAQAQTTLPQSADPRADAMQGSPETGYSGTWKDPATGDIITSVIAPTPQITNGQYQNYPIIIEPQVSGSDWSGNGSDNNWSDGSTGWNSHWPQWPGYPGDNGYPVSPPPQRPGRPWPGSGNWQPHPVMPPPPNVMPPFPPGYRPLRPMAPFSGGVPGVPGVMPNPNFPSNPVLPPPGVAPFPPSGNPGPVMPPQSWKPGGWQPGPMPSGGGWKPGAMPPAAAPSIPGYNPPAIIPGYNPPAVIPGYTPMPTPGAGAGFPVSPANPGIQPRGELLNGPGPGFQPSSMRRGGHRAGHGHMAASAGHRGHF